MIAKNYTCHDCGSKSLSKNGFTSNEKQRYLCKDCGSIRILEYDREPMTAERKAEIMKAYEGRMSMRMIASVFKISRVTLATWIREKAEEDLSIGDTVVVANPDDVLEFDELCSYVQKKKNKVWIWAAICKRTRQIVGIVMGDRSERSCRKLWEQIPSSYRQCQSYSDFYKTYGTVLDNGVHKCVGKETGLTNHIERFWNTMRQKMARLVRKTLSFSKNLEYHWFAIKNFVVRYNLSTKFMTDN